MTGGPTTTVVRAGAEETMRIVVVRAKAVAVMTIAAPAWDVGVVMASMAGGIMAVAMTAIAATTDARAAAMAGAKAAGSTATSPIAAIDGTDIIIVMRVGTDLAASAADSIRTALTA
jgi:hypothetical protein